ncbi:uncharacterized protein LOC131950156 [Physella acuta]|uniref:uncharacterized protein LOC131950156 n=1 Tax=Physella acuta TaxID=109671 RepID=UPI0027DE3C18|nr:uncharacterized protein LOC131950156 [Physella acuta]
MNTILHVVYIALFVVVINGQTCEPCKENNPRTISFISRNVSSSVNQFIWISEGVTAAVCYSQNGLECLLNPEARGLLSSTIEKKPDDVVNTSVTFTANRLKKLTSETKWELKVLDDHQSLKQLYTCDVKIYRSVPLPSCNYEASHKGLEVKCFSPFVYPTSVCSFNVRFVQTILNQMAVHYNHSITNTDPIYYTTECSLSVPQHLLMPGVLKYQVTMFPNITTTSATFSIKELEKTAKDTINIEFPSIKMVACPDLIEEGNIFNCTCERNDTSDIRTLVYWYSSKTTNEKFTILSETAIENASDFVCNAVSGLGWTSNINYSPTIKKKKSSNMLTCSSNKPYNCSNECYGDDEFCLKDAVYSCISPLSVIHLHEWCRTINVSDTSPRESKSCHKICLFLQGKTKDKNNDNLEIKIGISTSSLLIAGILIILLVIYRKPLLQLLKGANYENRNLNQDAVQHNNHLREFRLIEEDQQAVIPLLDLPNEHQAMESSGTLPQGPTRILQEVEVDEQNRTHCTSDDQLNQSNRFTQHDNIHQEGNTYLSDATEETYLMKPCFSMEDEVLDLRESHQSITVSSEGTNEIEPSTQYRSNDYQQQVTTDETEVAGLANTLEEDVTDDTNIIQDFTFQTDVIPQEECYEREKNPSNEGVQYQTDVRNVTLEDSLSAENNSSSSQPKLPIATKDELVITFHKLKHYGASVKVLLPLSIFTPISQLKENNKDALHIVAGYQQWEFAGTVLADDRCLKDYNIKYGDNITIKLI